MPTTNVAGMSVAQTITPGTVFGGDYEIERLLSSGGMGAVYIARQRSTQKLRALKTMLPELVSDPGLRARFAREASVGSRIESDHVVEVLAAGVDDGQGIPWIAMELLSGSDLATASRTRRLEAPEILELAKQFGHALTVAHRAGVVHRDLKPENLFLATPRREGVPFTLKVLDFGIAKITGVETSRATKNLLGSPLWLAPEQMDPTVPVTVSIDVWAVGLVFFWLLTGKHYWLTTSSTEGSLAMLLREIVVTPLVPASQRAAALGVVDRIPPGFDAWFARCVNRDPAARFRDAGEAFPALIALLGAGAPTAAASRPADAGPLAFGPTVPLAEAAREPHSRPAAIPAPSFPRSTDAPTARGRALPIALAIALVVSLGIGGLAAKLRKGSRARGATTIAGQPAPPVVEPAIPPVIATNTQAASTALAPSSTDAAPPPAHHHHARPDEAPAHPSSPSREPATPSEESAHCRVEAGPLWSNADAQSRCPSVCAGASALRFTGQWTTTRPGEMSVCECVFPAGHRCP